MTSTGLNKSYALHHGCCASLRKWKAYEKVGDCYPSPGARHLEVPWHLKAAVGGHGGAATDVLCWWQIWSISGPWWRCHMVYIEKLLYYPYSEWAYIVLLKNQVWTMMVHGWQLGLGQDFITISPIQISMNHNKLSMMQSTNLCPNHALTDPTPFVDTEQCNIEYSTHHCNG